MKITARQIVKDLGSLEWNYTGDELVEKTNKELAKEYILFGKVEQAERSLKLMNKRYKAKCKECEELKRHCEILAYESFRKSELIYETFGLEDGEE